MTRKLSVRFYSVGRLQPNGPSLQQALEIIAARNHEDRQVQVAQGMVIRLERLDVEADELVGEFTRVRDTDFPFEVHADGPRQLQTDGPLGTGIAFRFGTTDHTLAIQFDTRIVSPGRVLDYLMQFDRRFAFDIKPKLDIENWRKFNNTPVRKLRIGIASPEHLGDIEEEGAAVKSSIQQLSEAYDAPVITIEIGMGNRKGMLGEAVHGAARAVSDLLRGGGADVRSLRGWIKPDDGQPTEELNLIDEFLTEKLEFPSPRNDPEANYALRRQILEQSLRGHV
ncbi:MAG: hypothetical protein MI753_09570 [Hyphomicrobiales bacterium]|nr:hypothetical protein [Hyphomicrobiales bacterium]